MSDTIYLLDFRHGTVEEIDEALPPRGVREPSLGVEPKTLLEGSGFVLAALGTPPASGREE